MKTNGQINLSDHLDKLKAFMVIAESGKLNVAAKRLGVSQPSLTRLLYTLESAAGGTPLVTRGRWGVAPTEAGKTLLTYARSMLKNLEDIEQHLLHPNDRLAGHLQIGAYASLAEYLWPDFISEFKIKAPHLRLSIRTSETISHYLALEQGQIDMLVDAEPRVSETLISWKLYEDRFNVYSKIREPKALTAQTAKDRTLIYSPGAFDQDHKKILDHLEAGEYLFSGKVELDSFISVLAFARKGLGLAVLPQRLAASAVQSGQLHPVQLKGIPATGFGIHHFAATVRQSSADDPRIRFLLRALRGWFAKNRKPA